MGNRLKPDVRIGYNKVGKTKKKHQNLSWNRKESRLTYASTSRSVLNNNVADWTEATMETNINITKYGWFACPTQVFNHGQWWSIFITQRLPEIIR